MSRRGGPSRLVFEAMERKRAAGLCVYCGTPMIDNPLLARLTESMREKVRPDWKKVCPNKKCGQAPGRGVRIAG